MALSDEDHGSTLLA